MAFAVILSVIFSLLDIISVIEYAFSFAFLSSSSCGVLGTCKLCFVIMVFPVHFRVDWCQRICL